MDFFTLKERPYLHYWGRVIRLLTLLEKVTSKFSSSVSSTSAIEVNLTISSLSASSLLDVSNPSLSWSLRRARDLLRILWSLNSTSSVCCRAKFINTWDECKDRITLGYITALSHQFSSSFNNFMAQPLSFAVSLNTFFFPTSACYLFSIIDCVIAWLIFYPYFLACITFHTLSFLPSLTHSNSIFSSPAPPIRPTFFTVNPLPLEDLHYQALSGWQNSLQFVVRPDGFQSLQTLWKVSLCQTADDTAACYDASPINMHGTCLEHVTFRFTAEDQYQRLTFNVTPGKLSLKIAIVVLRSGFSPLTLNVIM